MASAVDGAERVIASSSPPAGHGCLVWITGRPSAGKSTLARAVQRALARRALPCVVLDSDDVRRAIAPGLGYTAPDRDRFYASLARMAALLADQGLIVLVAATAHRAAYRDAGRALVTSFVEVLVDTPAAACEARDDKGLYASARDGLATDLPGVGCAFERGDKTDIVATGGQDAHAVERIVERVMGLV